MRLALWAVLLSTQAFAWQGPLDARVGEILSEEAQPSETPAIGRRLAGLGTEALPILFDCLRDGSFQVRTEEGFVAQSLSLDQTNAVLEALQRTPVASLKSFLHERTLQEPTPENRRTALRLMALVARESDLSFCMQLAEPITPEEPVDPAAAKYLQRCLEKILTESESAFRRLRAIFERAHLDLRPTLVRAVTSVGTDAGFEALSEFLTVTKHLESFILSSMGRIAKSITLPVDQAIASRVRNLERSADPKLVREALLLLGRIEDAESVPRMIERLDSEDENLRGAAHWALKNLSGLGLREEPRRWSMWHEDENFWWREHAPEVLNWLRSSNTRDRKRAIAILSQRRLRRHTLARELLPLLTDSDATVVIQAVRALTILDARSAAPKVERLLEHPTEAVRESAKNALAAW